MSTQAMQESHNTDQSGLHARLLGDLRLRYQDRLIPERAFRRRRSLTLLLALLLASGRQLPREVLLERLWPEGNPGASADNLNSVISALRAALGGGSHSAVVHSRGGLVALAPELHVDLDVTAFEEAAAGAIETGDRTALLAAAALYNGPLLPGLPYEDWVEPRRESLGRLHRRVLTALAALETASNPDAAEERLHALLTTEPTNETAARRLMRLLGARGQRAEALRVYDRLRRVLQQELDMAPSQRTQELYAAFRVQQRDVPETVAVGAEAGVVGATPHVAVTQTLPTGILTFLLTEVEGSTLLWEQQPAAMQIALARHDTLVGQVMARHGGRQIKERGEGDSIVAVFTIAGAALVAACALQEALIQESWLPETPLRVRMSLHTGEAVPNDGRYDGVTVKRAARIRSLAHGGQILLSRATHDMLRDALPEGLGLLPLGVHVLHGLERPEELFQVSHPRLLHAFPPLPSPQTPKHNLPRQADAFIGRGQAQAEVVDLLRHVALVTLTGSGGVGKTRLALAVAEQVVAAYPAGIWLVELAPLAHPSLLRAAVAQAVGLREDPGRDLEATLSDHLRDRRMLLVLDNCEHLVGACASLASTLLRAAPHLQILATSREGLSVAGEVCYRVPSLSVPDPGTLPPLELIPAYEAVRLFVTRAQALRHDFALSEQNAASIAAICVRLDGIPLAIELAAARVGVLSVAAIADRLDDRFRLLTGGPRDALPRQQTLQAALDWSWALLSQPERSLLRRLSVFSNGWTLRAAEVVCQGEDLPADAVLDVLAALVAKSLVQHIDHHQESRYAFLETVQQYARDRLITAGEETAWRDRQLRWAMALAEAAEPELTGSAQERWLARLEIEHGNLRAALAWAEAHGPTGMGLRLAGALWRFWYTRGFVSEGWAWCERVLARDRREAADENGRWRAKALVGAAGLAYRQGDFAHAVLLAEAGRALYHELDDHHGRANALTVLAVVAREEGNLQRARDMQEDILAIRRTLTDRHGTAAALHNLGEIHDNMGDYPRARALYEESLAISRADGSSAVVANTLNSLGSNAWMQGDLDRAELLCGESLAVARRMDAKSVVSYALTGLGTVALTRGRYDEARQAYDESLALRREVGDTPGVAGAYTNLAHVARSQGRHADAGALYRASLALHASDRVDRNDLAECLQGLADVWNAQVHPDRAAWLLGVVAGLYTTGSGAVPAPANRAEFEHTTSRVRATLGAGSFEVAWAAGQAMPLEEALALALKEDPAGLSGGVEPGPAERRT